MYRYLSILALGTPVLWAQESSCNGTPVWSACDMVFDLEAGENGDGVELHGEFRSPDHKTYLLYAFRDSDRRYVIRFTPTEPGEWSFRLTSSLSRLDGQLGNIAAAQSDAPGFVRPANVHHFATANNKPHLWMGTAVDNFMKAPRPEFDALVVQRAAEKFTHLRVTLETGADLHEAAERIRAVNGHGLVADIVLASLPEDPQERRQYTTEIVRRFAAFNITWMGVPGFENLAQGKPIVRDWGLLIAKLDPYQHPRTSMAEVTSASLAGDQWMHLFSYGTPDANIGAVEHQLYQTPTINTGIRSAHDLWTATMNGQYPASGSGKYMTAWFEFMSGNRYWDLEPYFDLDGGRALALEDTEYIVYVEKPGPVEVTVEDHSYNVTWMDPATGERIKAKDYKGRHFTGEPPNKSHPWVLHISREGRKEGMLRTYKFESRRVPVQEVEISPKSTPFEVEAPPEGDLKLGQAVPFSLKILRQSRATRSLLVEWTGEVVVDGQGFRVLGVGREGTLRIPANIANRYPAIMSLRVAILNANGKAYAIDKVYRLLQ
jgi:hypothetical protein